MKYYGLATTQTGASVLIDNLTDSHATALKEAKAHCKSNSLTFQSIQVVRGTNSAASTMQKRFASGQPTKRKRR